ncbi:unnamed product [Ostreococcus tauri]|uniref:Unnamed product n=2 Tax=Ostreococcus tauri TaxID=70448 RepID=A0A096PBM8_OSTTA|nr:unnamed product [Ostreococcus tauri]CEG02086.1 unnamed product [Ostreococcus tauri]|eukprot:XP_003082986.2 unnamed product [Ostreococcus tauri]
MVVHAGARASTRAEMFESLHRQLHTSTPMRALSRVARATNAGRRGGRKFEVDVVPIAASWTSARDESESIKVRWRRRAKTSTSAEATTRTRSDACGTTTVTWTREEEGCSSTATIATLFGGKDGRGFEAKTYTLELLRRRASDGATWETTARGEIDFAEFANVMDVRGSRVTIKLETKNSERWDATLECEIRARWLRAYDADREDAMTDLSCVSAIESLSVATDVTPSDGADEQDLTGFGLQSLLSPVAESVSPIVVRQSERREAMARAELETQSKRVNELEVALETIKNELEQERANSAAEKRAHQKAMVLVHAEIATAKEDAKAASTAKAFAAAKSLEDIEALEYEKNAAVRAKKELEFERNALERRLYEREADIARMASSREVTESVARDLELERSAHIKEIERYKAQLDAADAQLDALLMSHRNEKAEFNRELERQTKLRFETERSLESELEVAHAEADDLRQQFQNLVAETTALHSALKKSANEQKNTQINIALAEAAQAKCDLRAVTEELHDVRLVLDSHVNELIACKLAVAETQHAELKLRRELHRSREKALSYAERCTRMERLYTRMERLYAEQICSTNAVDAAAEVLS